MAAVACGAGDEQERAVGAGGSGGVTLGTGGTKSASGGTQSGSGGTANVAGEAGATAAGAAAMVDGGADAGSGSEEGGAAGAGNDAGPSKPLYAVMYEVYDDTGSTSYLNLLDSLEVAEVESRRLGSSAVVARSFRPTTGSCSSETPVAHGDAVLRGGGR